MRCREFANLFYSSQSRENTPNNNSSNRQSPIDFDATAEKIDTSVDVGASTTNQADMHSLNGDNADKLGKLEKPTRDIHDSGKQVCI